MDNVVEKDSFRKKLIEVQKEQLRLVDIHILDYVRPKDVARIMWVMYEFDILVKQALRDK